MKLEELLIILSKKTESNVNQTLLAESLGITRQTVSNRIKNSSQVTVSELKKIEDFFGISILNDTVEKVANVIHLDYYTDVFASCGNGNIVFSDEKIKLPISTMLISGFSNKKTYSMINASGNSMAPTIENGDKLTFRLVPKNENEFSYRILIKEVNNTLVKLEGKVNPSEL